jgi:hypothetical protein
MKIDTEHIRQKISAAIRVNQLRKGRELEQCVATSTLKSANGADSKKVVTRPRSAPSLGHRAAHQEENQNREGEQHMKKIPIFRPKSGVDEIFNMRLVGEAPAMPKKIHLQIPPVEYPISILSPKEKLQKINEHKKAAEMALLLQEALTPKSKSTKRTRIPEMVSVQPDVLRPTTEYNRSVPLVPEIAQRIDTHDADALLCQDF